MPGVRYCLQCMTSSILPPSILTTSSSFLFIPPSATAFSTLSLHDALPISLTPSAHHDCRYGRLFGGRGLCLLRGLFGPRWCHPAETRAFWCCHRCGSFKLGLCNFAAARRCHGSIPLLANWFRRRCRVAQSGFIATFPSRWFACRFRLRTRA